MRVVTMATAHYAATRAFAHQQHHLDHYGQYYNVSSSSPLESMDWKKKRRIDPPTNQQSNVFFWMRMRKMGRDFVPKKCFQANRSIQQIATGQLGWNQPAIGRCEIFMSEITRGRRKSDVAP